MIWKLQTLFISNVRSVNDIQWLLLLYGVLVMSTSCLETIPNGKHDNSGYQKWDRKAGKNLKKFVINNCLINQEYNIIMYFW